MENFEIDPSILNLLGEFENLSDQQQLEVISAVPPPYLNQIGRYFNWDGNAPLVLGALFQRPGVSLGTALTAFSMGDPSYHLARKANGTFPNAEKAEFLGNLRDRINAGDFLFDPEYPCEEAVAGLLEEWTVPKHRIGEAPWLLDEQLLAPERAHHEESRKRYKALQAQQQAAHNFHKLTQAQATSKTTSKKRWRPTNPFQWLFKRYPTLTLLFIFVCASVWMAKLVPDVTP